MRRILLVVLVSLVPARAFAQAGALVVVGGGGTGPEIVSKALALAGGKDAIVAVLPQSSAEPDAGDASVQMWLEAGAKEAAKIAFTDPEAAAKLRRATLIWIPGGDQNRFMTAIQPTGLADVIRERHREGAAIGGTSAGAAVLAEAMFTGEADLKAITQGATEIAAGLAILPDLLIDQHFLKRQRDNRLISAVLDRPTLVGVGIDESTAVIVKDRAFEVIGKSSVVVIDARHAKVERSARGTPGSGVGLTLSILHAGQSYSLK
jgi:cyanophycinase